MTLRYGLGDSVSISTYFGSVGEIGVNTTTNTIHIFDSVTEGGISLAKSSDILATWEIVNSGISTLSNVGIGTTTSTSKLQVQGNTNINNTLPATVSYASSFSVAAQNNAPREVSFSNDGKTMYVIDQSSNNIYYYTLSTPWDITSASHVSQFSIASQLNVALGLTFKPDGTKFYITGNVGAAATSVSEYSCTTPWNLTTAGYTTSFSVLSQDNTPQDVEFSVDGTEFYVLGSDNDSIYQYSCTTPWSIATGVSFVSSFSVVSEESSPQGLAFSQDGTKLLLTGLAGDDINYYTLSTPWDITTTSFVGIITDIASVGELAPTGLYWKPDGTKLYVSGNTNDSIYEFNITSDAQLEVTGKTEFYGDTEVYQDLNVYGESYFGNNVGIGTINPLSAFHAVVSGESRALFETNSEGVHSILNIWNNNSSASAGTGMLFSAGSGTSGITSFIGGISAARIDTSNNSILSFRVLSNGSLTSADNTAPFYVQGNSSGATVGFNANVGIGTIIDIVPYDTLNNGTLSFEGSAGQLFSITNNLTSGSIFSVNDVSGIPSIDVNADGTVLIAPYGSSEYVGIGITNPSARLHLYNAAGSASWRLRIGTNVSDGAGFYQRTNGEFEVVLRDASNNNNYIVGSSGNLSLRPTSNVLINTETATGTSSQPLQVNGGGYFSGNVGINSTNPGSRLSVGGSITELSQGQYWNVVTQADVGIGASQVPLNQYLGQLAFLDEFGTNIPQNSQTAAYTLVREDSGKHISITTGGVTVPAGVFEIGDNIMIYNNSGSSQTITQGGSVTLRFAGSASTGNRTLSQYGLATILCVASNTFVISGSGLS